MSLHDMYFSKKNKNYMYEILSKVIHDETGIQIINSEKYINLYRLHYSSIFIKFNTDEITILNKELINYIGDLILKDINSPKIIKSTIEDKINSNESIEIKNKKNISLYSSQRLKNSLNRYNFSISVDFNEFSPKSITLLKEQNSLFSNPNINVLFNDKDNLQFILKSKQKIGENEYYTYECLIEDKIQCENILQIRVRNYIMNDCSDKPDIYQIHKIKKIKHENKDHLCLEINDHDLNNNDELGLFLSDNDMIRIDKSIFVTKIIKNYILTDYINLDLSKSYSCIEMNKNITINGQI